MLRFMRLSHSIRGAARLVAIAVALTAAAAGAAHAQTPSTFTVFVRSTPIGSEQVAVERTATGWTITSSGRVGPPVDLILRSFEARYDADWKPLHLQFDQTLRRAVNDSPGGGDRHRRPQRSDTARRRGDDSLAHHRPARDLSSEPLRGAVGSRIRPAPHGNAGRDDLDLPAGAGIVPDHGRTDDGRADQDRRSHGDRAPDPPDADAGRRAAARHRSLGRRQRPPASRQRSGAGPGVRARGHRIGRRADRHDVAAERRGDAYSGQRVLARRHHLQARQRYRPPAGRDSSWRLGTDRSR